MATKLKSPFKKKEKDGEEEKSEGFVDMGDQFDDPDYGLEEALEEEEVDEW